MLKTLIRWLTFRQRQACAHSRALADILEGDVPDQSVSWCPDCGSIQRNRWAWRII